MTGSDVLSRGVDRGIITADQAARLRALEDDLDLTDPPPNPDDEQLRLITGFSDVFVTIGLVMFVGASAHFFGAAGGAIGFCLSIMVLTWLLAEFFTRKRRMALPSIVLLVAFAVSAFEASGAILLAIQGGAPDRSTPMSAALFGNASENPVPLILASLIAVALTALHYRRFRVPITIAAGCALVTVAVLALSLSSVPKSPLLQSAVVLLCGIAVFALTMHFDMSDPMRITRRTDIAFWLHLLAAPLIVHSLIGSVVDIEHLTLAAAIGTIAVFCLLSFAAVLIDRRALLVSGLSYAGFAFATLIQKTGFTEDLTPVVTILVLGAFVLLLSAGWQRLRSAVVATMPQALTRRLPQASVHAA